MHKSDLLKIETLDLTFKSYFKKSGYLYAKFVFEERLNSTLKNFEKGLYSHSIEDGYLMYCSIVESYINSNYYKEDLKHLTKDKIERF